LVDERTSNFKSAQYVTYACGCVTITNGVTLTLHLHHLDSSHYCNEANPIQVLRLVIRMTGYKIDFL